MRVGVYKCAARQQPARGAEAQYRDRKRRGEPVWYLVPDGVVQYISKHRLYQHLTQETQESAT